MLLAIDTATTTASLAIYDLARAALLAEWTWQARRRHTQDLLEAAQTLLRQVDVAPAGLTALAVTTGPGSFTGVRIGISTVKGMALGLATPPAVIGVPTLAVTAAPWIAPAARCSAVVCACLQAGRGRFNWAYFDAETAVLTAEDHHVGAAEEFAAALAQRAQTVWLAGEADEQLMDHMATVSNVVCVEPAFGLRRAGVLAHLAAQEVRGGRATPLATLQPLYLRAP